MELTSDITTTYCPYCGSVSGYVCREIEIGNINPSLPRRKAIEIYCGNCHRTLSVTPVNR